TDQRNALFTPLVNGSAKVCRHKSMGLIELSVVQLRQQTLDAGRRRSRGILEQLENGDIQGVCGSLQRIDRYIAPATFHVGEKALGQPRVGCQLLARHATPRSPRTHPRAQLRQYCLWLVVSHLAACVSACCLFCLRQIKIAVCCRETPCQAVYCRRKMWRHDPGVGTMPDEQAPDSKIQETTGMHLSHADHSTSPPRVDIPRDYNAAHDLLARNAARSGKVAFVDASNGAQLTYGELTEQAHRFANALRAGGFAPETRVMLAMLDTLEWPVVFLDCILAGVIPIATNTLLTNKDFDFMLRDSRAQALFVSKPLLPSFEGLIGNIS